jgi:class 3 adenylate cyclase
MSSNADDDRRHSAMRHIKAPHCAIYNVFNRPQDLVRWMPPQGAVGRIEAFEPRETGDGVMVVFNDPVPMENPALQAVLMALEVREAIGALTETWRRLGHDIGFGIGIAHGFATLGTIGFEGRFDYAAIGTVSNVASRLCDEAKPGQILISPRVLTKVENVVKVEPVGEFELKGIRRPLAAYNVVAAQSSLT